MFTSLSIGLAKLGDSRVIVEGDPGTTYKWQHFWSIHFAGAAVDVILGIAAITIGILGSHFGFLTPEFQYALIGAGTAYTIAGLAVIGMMIAINIRDLFERITIVDWIDNPGGKEIT
jgi:hypothetical protein